MVGGCQNRNPRFSTFPRLLLADTPLTPHRAQPGVRDNSVLMSSYSHWAVTVVLIPRTVNSIRGGRVLPAFSGQYP
jgi:hypothetical protein